MNPISRLSMPSNPEKSFKINERYKDVIAEDAIVNLDDARVISKEE